MKMTNQKFTLTIDELESFKFPLDELFDLQVNYNDVKYEFLVRFSSKNKNLICMGSGAFDPKKISPPIYNRFTWESEFEESIIYYNDPTLYLDSVPRLRLGWGVGRQDEWYILVIADIINILAQKNNIKFENILFFGSSAGGFTSILLSTLIKNSSAMVNNMFCRLTDEAFDKIEKVCFDNLDRETILTLYRHRFDVIKMCELKRYLPPITYLVNVNSPLDVEILTFFINSLAPFINFDYRINILLYPKENGHNGVLDKEETIELIKNHFTTKVKPTSNIVDGVADGSVLLDAEQIGQSETLDITAPTASIFNPAMNEDNMATNRVIKVTFDKKIKKGTGWIELKDENRKVIPSTTSINDKILTIIPTNLLSKGEKYTLWIHAKSLTDMAGNPVAFYASVFTTSKGPAITTVYPAQNAINIPTFKLIKVTFDDNIKKGTGWIELKDRNGAEIPIIKIINGKSLTIAPTDLLVNGEKYTLWIHAKSLTDMAGNPVAFYASSFTTINEINFLKFSKDNIGNDILNKEEIIEPIKNLDGILE